MTFARLLVVSLLTLTLTGCKLETFGPVVDLDWCAQAHIDEAAVTRDLQARAAQHASFQALSYKKFRPPIRPRPMDRPVDTPADKMHRFYDMSIDIANDAPVMQFPSGPSRVAAVELPSSFSAGVSLFIQPEPSGRTVVGKLDCAVQQSGTVRGVRASTGSVQLSFGD